MSDQTYLARVVKKLERSGPGGPITICQLELLAEKRTMTRAIVGPVSEGHIITLLDCEREHRRGKY